LDPAPETPLDRPLQVTLRRAVPLTITQGGQTVTLRSAAARVGEALADAGLSLQGLDTTIPPESQPIPADGRIQLVRVQEQVLLEQKTIPFKSQYQADPETELDQRSVLQPGVTGLIVARVRVRTEDGKEVSRQKESEWTAREPKDQVVGYGTKVVVHTETVDGATIQYWRKLTAYATSYSPCTIYADHCSYTTASGATLSKGVIAVVRSWYNQLKGAQVYIPGYGQATIADIGGGVGGQNWVDLGYSESDYVGWHQNVTVYFLAPAPANIGWGLP
jgi:3D (Asp-Asp-Asp) domain-containing protein